MRRFDHLDLRVRSLEEVRAFYAKLLPALGFKHEVTLEGALQYQSRTIRGAAEFVRIRESPHYTANESRLAFGTASPAQVDRLAIILSEAGARQLQGPAYVEPQCYSLLFEDPSGNRFEICYRASNSAPSGKSCPPEAIESVS